MRAFVCFFLVRVRISDASTKSYINKLSEIVTGKIDMIVAIVPEDDAKRYSAIKKFLSCDNAGNCPPFKNILWGSVL